jgi:phospho-N-acetylmuramoyl-pentapeptide-transferase
MLLWILHQLGDWLASHGLYRYFGVLDQLQFRMLASACVSFLIVIALGKRTIRWLRAKKIGDTGSTDVAALAEHAGSKKNVPTMGGVLIAGAILGGVFLLGDLSNRYIIFGVVVCVWMAVLGGIDDWLKLTAASRGTGRQGLYSWEKLACQLGIGVLVGYFAFNAGLTSKGELSMAHAMNLPTQRTYVAMPSGASGAAVTPSQNVSGEEPKVLRPNPNLHYFGRAAYVVLFMLMVAGMSNAVNITDGMDGLAAGISTAVSTGMSIITLIAGSGSVAMYLLVPHVPGADELSVLAGAMVGACLGFLWWNCSPAQVFMGDTGSLALGGLIGYIASVTRQEFVILIMCGVFLMEIGSVVMQISYFKATKGKRIFKCTPIHHHFHMSGWTEQQVVARAWIVSVLLVVLALATIKLR